MGKDREGTFHPKKRKPTDEEINDISEDLSGVHTRHPNRNEDKHHERTTPDGRRGSIIRSQELRNDEQPARDNHVRQSDGAAGHFFVLILSKKNAKFFRGDISGLHFMAISELPNGVGDVGSDYHGIGSATPDDKENIQMYLKEVDKTLWQSGLNQEKALLVVGGVEYICAMFKDITQYKHVAHGCLTGSFENADPKEIYRKAKEIVNPVKV